MPATSMIEIELSPDSAIDPRLFTPPQERVYGERPEGELIHRRIKVRLGERPTARNVRRLFEAEGKELPPELKVYGGYEIWLIGLTLGVIKEGGWQAVTRLGLQVELPKIPRFIVIGLAPETRMIVRGKVGFECNAEVGANGAIAVPEAASAAIQTLLPATANGSMTAHLSVQAGLNLSFSVLSPSTIAVGKGDRRAEWIIEASAGPLLGDQELFFTVLTPIVAEEIQMTALVKATVSTFDLLPCLLQTPEMTVKALLQ
jgi:hypothetical protein